MEEEVIFGFDMTEIPAEYASAGEFALLPAGRYPFTIVKVDMGANKSGIPMVTLTIRVDGNEYGITTIRDYITLTSKSGWKIVEFFKALDAPVNPATNGIIMSWDPNGLVGSGSVVELLVEDYTNKAGESKQSNKVSHYRARNTPVGPFPQQVAQQQNYSSAPAQASHVSQSQAFAQPQPVAQPTSAVYAQSAPSAQSAMLKQPIPAGYIQQGQMPQAQPQQPTGYSPQTYAAQTQPVQSPQQGISAQQLKQMYQAVNQAVQNAEPVQINAQQIAPAQVYGQQPTPGRLF